METPDAATSSDAGSTAPKPAPLDLDGGEWLKGSGLPFVERSELERFVREAAAVPRGKLVKPPPEDAQRDAAIREVFGRDCQLERQCGPLWGINCRAEVDGPYYYVRPRPERLEEIATCGGACRGGQCTNCPPKKQGWTCPVY